VNHPCNPLTDDLELEVIRLQQEFKRIEREQKIKEESRKQRIAEEQSGQGWKFVPVSSKPKEVSKPDAFYWWTLAMGAVLGAIFVYVVMR